MRPIRAEDAMPAEGQMEALYRAHWSSLLRTAWMMCRSKEDAEDLVHDAFVRYAANTEASIDQPLAYLRKILVNLVKDQRRHRVVALRKQTVVTEPVLQAEDVVLWDLVQRLPLRQRQALVLRYLDDLSLVEIGELLDCPIPAVKSLIHRGLATLRGELAKQWTI